MFVFIPDWLIVIVVVLLYALTILSWVSFIYTVKLDRAKEKLKKAKEKRDFSEDRN